MARCLFFKILDSCSQILDAFALAKEEEAVDAFPSSGVNYPHTAT
jgi:hypothetical protein